MRVEHFPTLEPMREVYRLPRGPQRFRSYIAAVEGERPLLPISAYNPMAKEHVVERVEQLLALDAEAVAARAGQDAAARLAALDAELFTGLALADDVAGGWTNRPQITGPRLGERLDARRDGSGHLSGELGRWVTALLWASDEPTAEAVQQSVTAALYRWAHDERHGAPRTLGQFMTREGRAHRFAGLPGPTLSPDELAYSREVIAPLRDTTDQPSAFAAWWGDEIAASVGYPPLGLSRGAGYALALAEAQDDPVTALIGGVGQPVPPASL